MSRIGIDCRLWHETGVGRYIRNLVEQLHMIDHENKYVLFVLQKDLELLERKFQNENWSIVVSDIKWHTIAEQQKFPKIIEQQNLDLMHFTYFSVPIRYSREFVVTMHDMIPFTHATGKASTLLPPLYTAKRLAYKYVVKKALKNAARVIVPTKAVKEDIQKFVDISAEKIVVTHEGTSSFEHAEDPGIGLAPQSYFLYVGNAYPHKNVEKLLEGFLTFNASHPDIKLVLAGKKDYFYERLIVTPIAQALGDSLVIVESPKDAELNYLYRHALAFASASVMEGFALPALEALSTGTPVILSDIPVFREICFDIPIAYFDPKSTVEINHAMEKVLNLSPKKRKELGHLGQKLAKSYTWRDMAERTLKVYESCLGIRSGE